MQPPKMTLEQYVSKLATHHAKVVVEASSELLEYGSVCDETAIEVMGLFALESLSWQYVPCAPASTSRPPSAPLSRASQSISRIPSAARYIRGNLVERHHLPLDATEPRLLPDEDSPEDEMAIRLSHVPPQRPLRRVRLTFCGRGFDALLRANAPGIAA